MPDKPQDAVQPAEPAQVMDWLEAGEILLVDVRETTEYEREHIAGALLLPLSSFEADVFPDLAGKRVVLHCAVGKRSEAAGKMLIKAGRRDIVHMTGGMNAWKAAGFPTEIQIAPPDEDARPVFLCPPPGEVLKAEYLDPLGIRPAELAKRIGVLEGRLAEVIAGRAPVGVELSLRLARYFSTADDFWIHLQLDHDMEQASHSMGEEIRATIAPRTAEG